MQEPRIDSDAIFMCYSSQDEQWALRLARDLKARQVKVWIAPLDIPAGENWDTHVVRALKETHTTLVVLSPNSVESENVLDEINHAIRTGDRIVPILYQNCEVPFRIERKQRVDFVRSSYDAALGQLVAVLQSDQRGGVARSTGNISTKTIEADPGPVSPQTDHSTQTKLLSMIQYALLLRRRRSAWSYAVVAAFYVVVLLGLGLVLEGEPPSDPDYTPLGEDIFVALSMVVIARLIAGLAVHFLESRSAAAEPIG